MKNLSSLIYIYIYKHIIALYQTCLPEIGYDLMYSVVIRTNSISVDIKTSWLASVATL